MRKVFYITFLIVLVIACTDSSVNVTKQEKEIDISIGKLVSIPEFGLTIKFDSLLSDSRCPVGVNCIWAGNAEVLLKLKNFCGKTSMVHLNSYLEPKDTIFSDIRIKLVDLLPYPKFDSEIKYSNYNVKLLLMKKKS